MGRLVFEKVIISVVQRLQRLRSVTAIPAINQNCSKTLLCRLERAHYDQSLQFSLQHPLFEFHIVQCVSD